MKPVQQTDLLSYHFLSGVKWAPDGKNAAFVVSCANEKQDGYNSAIWLTDGKSARAMTSIGKERGFVWRDSTHLLFAADRTDGERERRKNGDIFTAWYQLDITGGEAMPLFTLPFACRKLIPLNETHFAVIAGIDTLIPDYADMTDAAREQVRKDRDENKDYEIFDESPFWGNGMGVTNKQRSALYIVTIDEEGSVSWERITEALEDVTVTAVIGSEIFFEARTFTSLASFNGCCIQAVDWLTSRKRTVLAHEKLAVEDLVNVGDELWLIGSTGERYGIHENNWVYKLNVWNGELSVIRKEEGSLYGIVGTDVRYGGGEAHIARGNDLYTLATRVGSVQLQRINAGGEAEIIYAPEGSIDCFTVSDKHDTALMIGLFGMKLQELYRLDLTTGKIRQLTHINEAALKGRYVAQPAEMIIRSEGLEITGWVLPPMDFDPQKSYPAVLDIHGGPKTVYGPVFMHEMQVWASMGCFVFYCNPKGSDGGDSAFADIRGQYGQTDYRNLMDFTDAVLAAYPQIDASRLCVTGGSYGGFMTNWIIGHTSRFCCAASQRSISNWVSMYGISDIGIEFVRDQADARVDGDVAKLWEQSPLKYAANVTTPTLFIHSDEDYRCPLAEGLQMMTALLEHGVPTRMCLFHGENHELSRSGKPKHRLRRLKEITDWFVKYAGIV